MVPQAPLGSHFRKHSENNHSLSTFGLLSSSKAQKLTPPLSSPTKSTSASSPYFMQFEFLGVEKEVKPLAASKWKKKMLENLDVNKIMTLDAVNGHQEDGVKDLTKVVRPMELAMGLT